MFSLHTIFIAKQGQKLCIRNILVAFPLQLFLIEQIKLNNFLTGNYEFKKVIPY